MTPGCTRDAREKVARYEKGTDSTVPVSLGKKKKNHMGLSPVDLVSGWAENRPSNSLSFS